MSEIKDLEGEIWLDISCYEGFYQISNKSRLKGLARIVKHPRGMDLPLKEKLKTSSKTTNGYLRCMLTKEHKKKYFSIHRLVAEAFIQNIENKPCVNHKDGNKGNNVLENLEWNTYKENTQHAHKNGLCNPVRGEKHNFTTKLTEKKVVEIRAIGRTKTTAEIGRIFGISQSHVSDILNKKKWNHVL